MLITRRKFLVTAGGAVVCAGFPMLAFAQSKVPEGYRVFSMPTTDDYKGLKTAESANQILFLAEPLSWSAIAAAICEKAAEALVEAAASAIIGEVVKSFLSGPVDFEKLLEDAFADFRRRLKADLDERDREKAMAIFRSTQNLMVDYSRDQKSRKSMLDQLLVQSSNNVEEFRRMGLPAIGGLTLASTLDISVNLQKYSLTRSPGNWSAVRDRAVRFRTSVDDLREQLIAQTARRFDGPSRNLVRGWCDDSGTYAVSKRPARSRRCDHFALGYGFDGVWNFVTDQLNREDLVVHQMNAAREALTRDQLEKIITPAYGVAAIMDQKFPAVPPTAGPGS